MIKEPDRESRTVDTLKAYLLSRIPRFDLPDAATWAEEAGKLRRTVLEEVIFKGVPDAWRNCTPDVEWTDVIETGKGYRIRKLTYHALPGQPGQPDRPGQPGLVIPSLLYEPDDPSDSAPGVLNLNGHVGPPGKAVDYKQIRCINLARRGVFALNPEWLSFGELQGPGYQHNNASYLELCGVAGIAVFYLAMCRGLEVLLDLEQVDPERIAVTGLSGGGWQTIILAALDTRVRLAAPNAGYIGLDYRVNHRADRGDIEQNASDLAATADYPMLTALLAPRPALLMYNENDDCCFQTARARPSVYEPVRPLYAALGRPDAFAFHNNLEPGTHNYEREHRERFYGFLNRHFLDGRSGTPSRDEEIPSEDEVRTEEELWVGTPAGNADFVSVARSLALGLKRPEPPEEPEALSRWQEAGRERLKSLLRYQPLTVERVTGQASRLDNGCRLEHACYHLRDGWELPAVTTIPTNLDSGGKRLIVADEGWQGAEGLVEDALRDNVRAMTVELVMQGACGLGKAPHQWTMMMASSGGRMLGLQVAQLAAVMHHEEPARLGVVAWGPMSSVIALMAASLCGVTVNEITLHRGLASLHRLIDEPGRYESLSPLFCFGLLAEFDIEDLIALARPALVELISTAEL
ncbi:MAG: acetylxylan esterase [Gemmatimonadetes bacterium]|nr:acetylxylan esterase [Gemmatimonadota bacterium]